MPDSSSSRPDAKAVASHMDEDAGPPDPATIRDKVVAAHCVVTAMEPETAASLGWQLVRCGNHLAKLDIKTWLVSKLISVSDVERAFPLVTRDHLIVQEGDTVTVVSLREATVVSLSHHILPMVSSDRKRLLVLSPSGAQLSIALDGNDSITLCETQAGTLASEDKTPSWVLCTEGQRSYSVDVSTGARRDLGAASDVTIRDFPSHQVAWLDKTDNTIHSVRVDGSEPRQWPAGAHLQATFVRLSGDGDSLIVSELDKSYWVLSLRDGTWKALASVPVDRRYRTHVTPNAILFDLESAAPTALHEVSLPVRLAVLPINGDPLIDLGEIRGASEDGIWGDSLSFSDDDLAAVFRGMNGSWRRLDLTTFNTIELVPDLTSSYYGPPIPFSPDGELTFIDACTTSIAPELCYELVLIDSDGRSLFRAQHANVVWPSGSFSPDSQSFMVLFEDETLLLGTRSGQVYSRKLTGWFGSPVTWLDARRILATVQGDVHMFSSRD